MDIEKYLEKKAKDVDKAIERWVPKRYSKGSLEMTLGKPRFRYHEEAANKAIAEPIWELLGRGGKRWRPALLLLVCEALGGDAKKFSDFAAIPELIHNGTLMVDDIEDKSELRRGKPCIHKIYGDDVAINAGNAMYYLPLLVVVKNKTLDSALKNKIYETYAQEMINISFGQAMDIAWHNGRADADSIGEEEYLQMCAYKTGTLARMTAKIGAILANADDNVIESAGRFAESMGVAFQIQDDVLNLTATSGKGHFTKDYLGEDIHEGKRTLLVVHTLKKADAKDKKRLLEILKMHSGDRKIIEEAINIIKKYDAFSYAKDFAAKLVREAWGGFEKNLKEGEAKRALGALAEFAMKREW